jgi:hypothetical protein
MTESGGNGGAGLNFANGGSGAGGGGLGAGGAFFIGGGGSATLDNVSDTGNRAIGGSGSTGFGPSYNYPKPGAGGTLNGWSGVGFGSGGTAVDAIPAPPAVSAVVAAMVRGFLAQQATRAVAAVEGRAPRVAAVVPGSAAAYSSSSRLAVHLRSTTGIRSRATMSMAALAVRGRRAAAPTARPPGRVCSVCRTSRWRQTRH